MGQLLLEEQGFEDSTGCGGSKHVSDLARKLPPEKLDRGEKRKRKKDRGFL
jgi:hypothetical protein